LSRVFFCAHALPRALLQRGRHKVRLLTYAHAQWRR
jgi:hypothetical protein